MSRKRLLLAIRMVSSVTIIGWLVWKADFQQLMGQLAGAKLTYLFLAAIVMNLDRVLMAFKWRLLVSARDIKLDMLYVIRVYYFATFGNLLLPTVGADAYRILVVSRKTSATDEIVASVVMERLLGMMATCLVAAVGTIVFVATRNESAGLRYALILFSVSLISFVLVGAIATGWLEAIQDRLSRTRIKALHRVGDILAAYASYSEHKRTLIVFLVWSVVERLPSILSAFLVSRALGLGIPFTYFFLFVPIIESSIKLPIPASFAGFGLSEGLYVYLFGTVGVDSASALSVGFISHTMFWVSILPVFLILYLSGERQSIRLTHEAS